MMIDSTVGRNIFYAANILAERCRHCKHNGLWSTSSIMELYYKPLM